MTYNQLVERIDAARVPDPGDVLSRAFELFKKTWLQGFLYVMLSFLLILPVLLIIYIPILGTAITESQGYDLEAHLGEMAWISLFALFGFFIVGMLFVQSLVMAVQAGLYRSFHAAEAGEEVRAGMLFEFLKWKYLRKTFVLSLFSVLIALVCLALCVLPVIYVFVPLYFLAVVFAFNPELNAVEILQIAFKLGNKTWFVSFVLIILAALLSQMVGVFTCGVGVLFTTAFVYMTVYHIYKGVINDGGEGEKALEIVPEKK